MAASTFPENSLLILLANVCLWWKLGERVRAGIGVQELMAGL